MLSLYLWAELLFGYGTNYHQHYSLRGMDLCERLDEIVWDRGDVVMTEMEYSLFIAYGNAKGCKTGVDHD